MAASAAATAIARVPAWCSSCRLTSVPSAYPAHVAVPSHAHVSAADPSRRGGLNRPLGERVTHAAEHSADGVDRRGQRPPALVANATSSSTVHPCKRLSRRPSGARCRHVPYRSPPSSSPPANAPTRIGPLVAPAIATEATCSPPYVKVSSPAMLSVSSARLSEYAEMPPLPPWRGQQLEPSGEKDGVAGEAAPGGECQYGDRRGRGGTRGHDERTEHEARRVERGVQCIGALQPPRRDERGP